LGLPRVNPSRSRAARGCPRPTLGLGAAGAKGHRAAVRLGLYTILPSPIVYGAWHTKEGSVGGRILRNGRALVLQ